MNWFNVVLAVACGAIFDTGERLEVRVQATDRLDAAIRAEAQADVLLGDPVKYTHARSVEPEVEEASAMALAA